MEIKLNGDNFKTEILDSGLPALVDFWAPWCGPCNVLAPTVEKIAKEYKGKIKVGKLNVDEARDIASRYKITGIPTLMIFINGKVVEEILGAESKEYIEEKINQHLNGKADNSI